MAAGEEVCANDQQRVCPRGGVCNDDDGCWWTPKASYRRGQADQRLRIAWWLRAGLGGPAMVSTDEKVLDALAELADLLEGDGQRWADAPTTLHPDSPQRMAEVDAEAWAAFAEKIGAPTSDRVHQVIAGDWS